MWPAIAVPLASVCHIRLPLPPGRGARFKRKRESTHPTLRLLSHVSVSSRPSSADQFLSGHFDFVDGETQGILTDRTITPSPRNGIIGFNGTMAQRLHNQTGYAIRFQSGPLRLVQLPTILPGVGKDQTIWRVPNPLALLPG